MSLQIYVSVATNNKNLYTLCKHMLYINNRGNVRKYTRNNEECFCKHFCSGKAKVLHILSVYVCVCVCVCACV